MDIVLFALIGATLNMGAAYWVCIGIYCFGRIMNLFLRD